MLNLYFRGLLFPREIIAVHINPGTHPNCGKKHLEAVEFEYCYLIEKATKDAEGKKKKKRTNQNLTIGLSY